MLAQRSKKYINWLIHNCHKSGELQNSKLMCKTMLLPTLRRVYCRRLELIAFKGCVSLDPSKISKSGWWGLQLDTWQLCNSDMAWLIPNFISIKRIFFYITQHQTVSHVQCFKSPSWPLRDGLDLWPQLIYTLSWESQHEEILSPNF